MVQCRPHIYAGMALLSGDEGSNPPTKIPVWGTSLTGFPGWSESETVSAGKAQATGTPGRQIWGFVAMGKYQQG